MGHFPQSSSASRFTAGASNVGTFQNDLIVAYCGSRATPEAVRGDSERTTRPSSPDCRQERLHADDIHACRRMALDLVANALARID
jgi:hypothetical protein